MSISNKIKPLALVSLLTLAMGLAPGSLAQSLAPPHAPLVEGLPVPVTAHPDQLSLLASPLPALAANKQLVFDMWRTVMLAGQVDQTERFFAADFEQHSPLVRNGREAFKSHFGSRLERQEAIPETIPGLVTLVAEGDFVVLAQVSHYLEPDGSGDTYTSTRFDVFRLHNGQIAAQWTSDQLRPGLNLPDTANGGPLPVEGIQGLAQHAMLFNDDPALFANKRLAFDLWRHIPEAGREEMAELYIDEIYIQHNPNAATGREGFKEYFSLRPDSSIDTWLEDPLVASVAEGDLVVQVLQEERPHPDTGETYYVAWIDMFRIQDGLVIEHWDTASKGELPLSMQNVP
ncbi:MAG TPA: SnoaL-like domain-containing protein [Pseudomonadaceae bacterium]|nr:SnoaL-like domain-containing protein [Pseudomonadaceae bacterium]